MNRKRMPQKSKHKNIRSNIKSRPREADLGLPHKKNKTSNRVSPYYFLSWVMAAAVCMGTVGGVVINEGGVDNAIRTASFKKINRQIEENKFTVGVDNLPTASINVGGGVNVMTPKSIAPVFVPNIGNGADNSILIEEKSYYSVFLGQGNSSSTILDLWYSIKNQNVDLFGSHEAGYYYDDVDGVYKLVVGKFNSLAATRIMPYRHFGV